MKTSRIALLAACLIGINPLGAYAAEPVARHHNTSERYEARQTQALLDRAVAYFKEKGDAAFPAFSRQGSFVDGEYYIYVVGMDGVMYASGGSSAALIGKNVSTMTDAAGKPFFSEMIAIAKNEGAGMIEYRWLNRSDNKVEPKVTLFRRIGDYIIAAGYYLPRSAPEQARQLLDQAVAAYQADSAGALGQFNDVNGRFVRDDLYVFAIGIKDGRYYANGSAPKLVGYNASDLKDAAGKSVIKEILDLMKRQDAGELDYVWRNPVTNRVEPKHTFVRKVDRYVVGVGYYTKPQP